MAQKCQDELSHVGVSKPFGCIKTLIQLLQIYRYLCSNKHVKLFIFRSGKEGNVKEYYTLECLLFILKNIHLTHPVYVRQAAVSKIYHEVSNIYRNLDLFIMK